MAWFAPDDEHREKVPDCTAIVPVPPTGTGKRPTKRTPETLERILEALTAGNTRVASAGYARCSDEFLRLWMRDEPAVKEAVEYAEHTAEVRNVAIIQRAAETTWQAAAWWLERKMWRDWCKKERQMVEILAQDVARRSDDDLLKSLGYTPGSVGRATSSLGGADPAGIPDSEAGEGSAD